MHIYISIPISSSMYLYACFAAYMYIRIIVEIYCSVLRYAFLYDGTLYYIRYVHARYACHVMSCLMLIVLSFDMIDVFYS